MTRNEDINITMWGFDVFRQSLPNIKHQDRFVLGAKYADSHPSDETIIKISLLKDKWEKDEKGIEKGKNFLEYAKAHWQEI